MSLSRKQSWQTDLHKFLLERANSPFVWGVRDCSLFCADAIYAMTGTDIAADFRAQYHDEESAFAAIKKISGGSTVADAAQYCAQKFGLTEWKHPLMARRGDLVVIENENRLIAAIVHLNGVHVVTVTEKGLAPFPIAQIKRAWHVPVSGEKAHE
jgi:hypothetical protein